jgi:hypothetical protein
MDLLILLEKIIPLFSAIIAGYLSWLLANQKNNNNRTNKEQENLNKERERLQLYFEGELAIFRKERDKLIEEVIKNREKIAILQDNEKECQEKLAQVMAYIKKKEKE